MLLRVSRRRTRVMVIGKEATTALQLADSLAADGYEVVTIATPHQALDVLPAMNPHVFVFDCHAAGADISQGVSAIRGRFPDLPVIAVLEDNRPEAVEESIKAGVSAYVVKPDGMDDIGRLLARQVRPVEAATARSSTA